MFKGRTSAILFTGNHNTLSNLRTIDVFQYIYYTSMKPTDSFKARKEADMIFRIASIN